MKVVAGILGLVFFSVHAFAGDLDPASQEALERTQELLTNSNVRTKAIAEDSKTQSMDQMMSSLANGDPQVKEAVYSLASQVFATIVKDSGGDPIKMKEAVNAFSRDPSSFAAQWTPEQKALLEKLSTQVNPAAVIPQTH